MIIHQISVFLENKEGTMAEITGILARENVDIRALSIADTTDFGILRLIVNDPEKALAALKADGMTVSLTEVIAVRLEDHSGSLHHVLTLLGEDGISVEYAYAFITRKSSAAYVILRVADNERAAAVLRDKGISLLDPADVYNI